MNFQVVVLPQAQRDVDGIYRWLAERSMEGANRWYERFIDSLDSLSSNPHSFGLAPEDEFVTDEIRHMIFKTRKGKPYRALFEIRGKQVLVLHVRGPGQDLLSADEIED